MSVMRAAQIVLAFACLGMLVGACSVAAEPSRSSVASVPSPTSQPSVAVAATSPSEAAPDSTPTATDVVNPTTDVPFSPDPTLTPPPDGLLAVEGGDPVVGELGTWSWNNAGSDAPWLPGYPIRVGVGERLTFALAERVPIESWTVSRVPPSSVPGNDGAVAMGDGTTSAIAVPAPPVGKWSVSVHVRFAGNRGDATYYWAVTVD
ncbi:MAG: hypothetical protein HY262_13365 [Chloroflexi bacterium]|nr:hypothetical protein [Chloroflexota bacterium]